MDETIERTRRHLAEAEADVVRLTAELAEAKRDVEGLRSTLELNLERKRQEEEMRLKREREESVAKNILRELRELDEGRRFRGPRRMNSEEFRRRRAILNDTFRARTDPNRLSWQELDDRHTYLKIFINEAEDAIDRDEDVTIAELEELKKAKAELEALSAVYFKQSAGGEEEEEEVLSPKKTPFRSGGKGLGGGKKKRHIAPPTAEERRQGRIERLQDTLKDLRDALQHARTEENRQIILEQISATSEELQELLGPDRRIFAPPPEQFRPRSPTRKTGRKGLGRPLTDAERREKQIDDLKSELEYYRDSLRDVDKRRLEDPNELRREYNAKIRRAQEKLDELLAGGPINACIACNERQAKPGRSFCGSACQREFLCTKMQNFYV